MYVSILEQVINKCNNQKLISFMSFAYVESAIALLKEQYVVGTVEIRIVQPKPLN